MSYNEEMVESLKFGLIDLFVLLLLQEEDMYGYKIKKEIEGRTKKVFLIKEGTLYGPLYRLKSRGFITNYTEFVNSRTRNYYHLEEPGKEFLQFVLDSYAEVTNATQNFIKDSLEVANKKETSK